MILLATGVSFWLGRDRPLGARGAAFESWEGQGDGAAKAAIGQTRADLMAHADDALTVARAADAAADSPTGVQARLYDLRDAAWRAAWKSTR